MVDYPLNLGYDMNLLGRRPSNVSLFTNLLLQLCAEAGLCIVTAWTKGKRGISVIVGASNIPSYKTLIAARILLNLVEIVKCCQKN